MKIIHSKTYEEYKQQQLRRFYRKRSRVFVLPGHMQDIAATITKYCERPIHGLCHGVRTGYESKWLADALSADVIGTDIGPIEGPGLRGEWDFHSRDQEWINAFSFVYSNALDHSDRPNVALETWVEQLSPGGVLILHWSRSHSVAQNRADCFGASLDEYESLVTLHANYIETIATARHHRLVVGRKEV